MVKWLRTRNSRGFRWKAGEGEEASEEYDGKYNLQQVGKRGYKAYKEDFGINPDT